MADIPDLPTNASAEHLTSIGRIEEAPTGVAAVALSEEILKQSANPTERMLRRLGRKFLDLVYETTVMIAYIGAIALLHHVLDSWLGKDVKFFNYLPISYIIDFGHFLVISRFLLEVVKDIFGVVINFSKDVEE